jgi:transposase
MDTIEKKKRTRVRAYPAEFKARLVAECEQPGTSVAKVALAHGINANMLHAWRRAGIGGAAPAVRDEFVSLPLGAPVAAAGTPIRVELRQGALSIAVAWPTEAADACGAWLRELLR